jgi:hypothetical protein
MLKIQTDVFGKIARESKQMSRFAGTSTTPKPAKTTKACPSTLQNQKFKTLALSSNKGFTSPASDHMHIHPKMDLNSSFELQGSDEHRQASRGLTYGEQLIIEDHMIKRNASP